jgi:hypothetical protein
MVVLGFAFIYAGRHYLRLNPGAQRPAIPASSFTRFLVNHRYELKVSLTNRRSFISPWCYSGAIRLGLAGAADMVAAFARGAYPQLFGEQSRESRNYG